MTLPWIGVQYKTIMSPAQIFGHMFAGDLQLESQFQRKIENTHQGWREGYPCKM